MSRRLLPQLALAAWALAIVGAPVGALAQQPDSVRQRYRIELPAVLEPVAERSARSLPGSTFGSPSAFGADWGDVFAGAGFQARTRGAPDGRRGMDGTAVAGFGAGDARRLVGLEVAFTSVSTVDSGFLERTALSFKLHRLLPRRWGIAIGYENALRFGEGLDGGRSLYGVVSRVWDVSDRRPRLTATTSVGLGSGRFRPERDVREGNEGVNLFASLGVHVWEPVSLIADWTGQDLTLAASVVPFRRLPLVVTPGFADLTGSAGDGARFVLGVGVGATLLGAPLSARP